MDRMYLKQFMLSTGKKFGYIADEIGANQAWLSNIFAGAPISKAMARSISFWVKDNGGDISAEKLMEANK